MANCPRCVRAAGCRLQLSLPSSSDSTGASTGNLIGVACGDAVLPPARVVDDEARAVLLQLADQGQRRPRPPSTTSTWPVR